MHRICESLIALRCNRIAIRVLEADKLSASRNSILLKSSKPLESVRVCSRHINFEREEYDGHNATLSHRMDSKKQYFHYSVLKYTTLFESKYR